MPLLRKSGIDEAVKVNCIKFITLNTLFYILCDDIALLLHGKVVVCTLGKLLGQNVQGFHASWHSYSIAFMNFLFYNTS